MDPTKTQGTGEVPDESENSDSTDSLHEEIQRMRPRTPQSVLQPIPRRTTTSTPFDNADLWDQVSKMFTVLTSRVEQQSRTLDAEWQAVRATMLDVEVVSRLMQSMIGDFDQLLVDQREAINRIGLAASAIAKATQALQELAQQSPTLIAR